MTFLNILVCLHYSPFLLSTSVSSSSLLMGNAYPPSWGVRKREVKSEPPLKLVETRFSIFAPDSLLPFKSFSFSSYAWGGGGGGQIFLLFSFDPRTNFIQKINDCLAEYAATSNWQNFDELLRIFFTNEQKNYQKPVKRN